MKFRSGLSFIFLCAVACIVLSSCHSRKTVMKGRPGEMVKADKDIAEKYSEKMGVSKSDIKNGRLYAFIEDWMGTPYRFGGQEKSGIDCSGFVQLLEQQVYGVLVPRSTG